MVSQRCSASVTEKKQEDPNIQEPGPEASAASPSYCLGRQICASMHVTRQINNTHRSSSDQSGVKIEIVYINKIFINKYKTRPRRLFISEAWQPSGCTCHSLLRASTYFKLFDKLSLPASCGQNFSFIPQHD